MLVNTRYTPPHGNNLLAAFEYAKRYISNPSQTPEDKLTKLLGRLNRGGINDQVFAAFALSINHPVMAELFEQDRSRPWFALTELLHFARTAENEALVYFCLEAAMNVAQFVSSGYEGIRKEIERLLEEHEQNPKPISDFHLTELKLLFSSVVRCQQTEELSAEVRT